LNDTIIIIIGMMIVTYIPRIIPFFTFSGKHLPKKVEKFLEFVPYTALGALIIPGAITSIPGEPVASVIGLGFAAIYSYFKGGMIVSIIGSMAVVYLMLIVA